MMFSTAGVRRRIALWLCPALGSPEIDVAANTECRDHVSESDIAGLILRLGDVRGWKPTYASRMASGSGDTLSRINGGIGLTIRRANAIIQRCSDLWPEGAVWPGDIPRPTQSGRAA